MEKWRGGAPAATIPQAQSCSRLVATDVCRVAFARNIPDSGAGIGPLGVAFHPDGQTIYVSGGPGRNLLYRFNLAGGAAASCLTSTPISSALAREYAEKQVAAAASIIVRIIASVRRRARTLRLTTGFALTETAALSTLSTLSSLSSLSSQNVLVA